VALKDTADRLARFQGRNEHFPQSRAAQVRRPAPAEGEPLYYFP
jgi:hypothetical protein